MWSLKSFKQIFLGCLAVVRDTSSLMRSASTQLYTSCKGNTDICCDRCLLQPSVEILNMTDQQLLDICIDHLLSVLPHRSQCGRVKGRNLHSGLHRHHITPQCCAAACCLPVTDRDCWYKFELYLCYSVSSDFLTPCHWCQFNVLDNELADFSTHGLTCALGCHWTLLHGFVWDCVFFSTEYHVLSHFAGVCHLLSSSSELASGLVSFGSTITH